MNRQQYGNDEMYDSEYEYYYPPTSAESKPERAKAGFYTFIAVLLALLSVGGLFLGLIPALKEYVPFLEGEYLLSGSLIGIILAVFMSLFGAEGAASIPAFTLENGLQSVMPSLLFYFLFVLVACIVLTLVFAVVSLLPQKETNRLPRAGVCAYACGFFTVIGYGGLFLLNLLYYACDAAQAEGEISFFALLDLPLAIVAGVALLLLIVTAIKNGTRTKRVGLALCNAVLLLCSVATIVFLAHPASPLFLAFNAAIAGTLENIAVRIFSIAAYAVCLLVVLFSLFRIFAKGTYPLTIALFAVQIILLAVQALLLAFLYPDDFGGMAIFTGLPVLIALIASVVGLLFAIIATVAGLKYKGRERQIREEQDSRASYVEYDSDEDDEDEEDDEDDEDEDEEEEDDDEEEEETAYVKVNVPIQLPQSVTHAEPAAAPQQAQQTKPSSPAEEEPFGPFPQRGYQSGYYAFKHQYGEAQQTPPTQPVQPVQQAPQAQQTQSTAPVQQAPMQPVQQPAQQPAPQQAPAQPTPPAAQPQQPRPAGAQQQPPRREPPRVKSQFELEMEAIARGELKRKEETRSESLPQERPAPQGQRRPVAAPAGNNASATYIDSQYTYDPFLNTLTTPEKNEFCDIFIANKYGSLRYVPAYVIGGDNAGFFRKVFIYLGKFRANISDGLLDKMYYYVSQRD